MGPAPTASPATPTAPPLKLKTKASTIKNTNPTSAGTSRASSPTGLDNSELNSASASQAGDGTTQRCKHCKKQKPKEGFGAHSKQCLRDKQQKKRESDEANADPANPDAKDPAGTKHKRADSIISTTAGSVADGDTIEVKAKKAKKATTASEAKKDKDSKKRKAADDDTASLNGSSSTTKPPPKKQKKKDAAAAAAAAAAATAAAAGDSNSNFNNTSKDKAKPAAKPKGPVDVERQCGVLMPNGAMCARSLTCKSHAMGLKRAVPGRSLPYDILLAQYQKKNQAKQQKAAMASTQPLPEDLALEGAPGAAPVDSDEERDAVMAGIRRAAPKPIWERPVMSSKTKTGYVRLKEQMSNALGGVRGSNLFSTAAHPANNNWANSPLHSRASSISLAQQNTHSRQMSIDSAAR